MHSLLLWIVVAASPAPPPAPQEAPSTGLSLDELVREARGLREEVARALVTAEEWAYEAARRRVAAQVAETYHDLAATEATVAAVEESRILLDQLSRVATTRFSVGQSTQHDVFDAEVELSQALERGSTLVQRRSTEQALLAQLVFRSAPIAVTTPLTVDREPLPDSLDTVVARALEGSPVVREREALVGEAERRLELARREKLPDLGVSVTYTTAAGCRPTTRTVARSPCRSIGPKAEQGDRGGHRRTGERPQRGRRVACAGALRGERRVSAGLAFLPIFALQAQEGRLFKPLAFTKNTAMAVAAVLAITLDLVLRLVLTRLEPYRFRPRWLSAALTRVVIGKIEPEEKTWLSRKLMAVYHPVLLSALRHRYIVVGLALLAMALTVLIFLSLGSEFMPPGPAPRSSSG